MRYLRFLQQFHLDGGRFDVLMAAGTSPFFSLTDLCPLGVSDLAEYEISEYARIEIKENLENIDGD